MKIWFCIFVVFCTGCADEPEKGTAAVETPLTRADSIPKGSVTTQQLVMLDDSVSAYLYDLDKPIRMDLNCDGQSDEVMLMKTDSATYLVVVDGGTRTRKILGQDIKVENDLNSDYSWVDMWGITPDTTTWEAVIEDGEIMDPVTTKLSCPSLLLRKKEEGGGIITFAKGKYKWVHQAE